MFAKKIVPELNKALEENNILSPISKQKEVFSKIKSGVDLLWIGETGIGKTTAMTIGIINQIKEAINDVPRALIIEPNADAAFATTDLLKRYSKYTNIRIFCAHSKGIMDDIEVEIYNGSDIVVGTPSKIGEFYSTNVLNVTALKILAFNNISQANKISENSQLERISMALDNTQKIMFDSKLDMKTENLIGNYFKSPYFFE